MEFGKEYALSELEDLLSKAGVKVTYSEDVWLAKERKIHVASNLGGKEKVMLNLK